jgi:hypothetical protein
MSPCFFEIANVNQSQLLSVLKELSWVPSRTDILETMKLVNSNSLDLG